VQAYVARTGPDERTRALSMVASSFGSALSWTRARPLLILPGLA
jgi:hypothetical protein